jgi:hypothetical protein
VIKHNGTLPVGIEVDGVVHRDFELRPQLVRDSIEVSKKLTAEYSDSYFGIALYAEQLVKLGTLPKEAITAELLLDAYDMDMQVIMKGADSLRERLKTFRDEGIQSAENSGSTA